MAGPSASRASRRHPYSGTAAASLPHPSRRSVLRTRGTRLAAATAVLSLGLLTGGCAVSGVLGFGREDSNALARADTTGSIPPSGKLSSGLPPESDLVHARSAITEVLDMRRKDFSTAWENPSSGARGTVTPIAAAYSQDGVTCHD